MYLNLNPFSIFFTAYAFHLPLHSIPLTKTIDPQSPQHERKSRKFLVAPPLNLPKNFTQTHRQRLELTSQSDHISEQIQASCMQRPELYKKAGQNKVGSRHVDAQLQSTSDSS